MMRDTKMQLLGGTIGAILGAIAAVLACLADLMGGTPTP